jgi:hypothetical protein
MNNIVLTSMLECFAVLICEPCHKELQQIRKQKSSIESKETETEF